MSRSPTPKTTGPAFTPDWIANFGSRHKATQTRNCRDTCTSMLTKSRPVAGYRKTWRNVLLDLLHGAGVE